MKVSTSIKKSASRTDVESLATIYIRLRDGRGVDMTTRTQLSINPNMWDSKSEEIKSRVVYGEAERTIFNSNIRSLKSFIEIEYTRCKGDTIGKDWLKVAVDKFYNPSKYLTPEQEASLQRPRTVHELYLEFLEKHKLSEVRQKNFLVIGRAMRRYELFIRKTESLQRNYSMLIDEITTDTLRNMESYFKNEYKYYDIYPEIFKEVPSTRVPQKRGHNTISEMFTRLRTFFLWCYTQKYTSNRPFDNFKIDECRYGSPIYITIEERNRLYGADFSDLPALEIQRDIFVFQCLIGCRIGDLMKMRRSNIINSAIEYIPRKTKEGRPQTLRVPLSKIAKEILDRYEDHTECKNGKLLPFISEQKYNVHIKEMFRKAGLDRMVTIINPTTSEEEKEPIWRVASSHMARKTFVGNLYKKVKDPSLVGALSGHKEGSKAFARYREIDEDIKIDLINMLE